MLALLFAWLLPTGLDLIRLWPNPPKHMADALAAFKRLLGKLDLQTVMGFGGYYMAGYYFSQAHMSKRNLYFVQALGLLGAGATIGLSGWLTAKAGHLRLTLYSYNSFFVMLESSAFFLSLQTLKPRLWSEEVLGELAGSVMGIYLLPPLLIYYWGKTPVWQLAASNSAWLGNFDFCQQSGYRLALAQEQIFGPLAFIGLTLRRIHVIFIKTRQ